MDFHLHFFQHNSLSVRSAAKRVGLQGCAQMGFLVLLIMPLLVSLVATELPGSTKTATLAHPAGATGLSERREFVGSYFPQPGIKPWTSRVRTPSVNHWATWEFPILSHLISAN